MSLSSPAPSTVALRKVLPRDGDVLVSPLGQLGAAIQEIVTEHAAFQHGLAACKETTEEGEKSRGR